MKKKKEKEINASISKRVHISISVLTSLSITLAVIAALAVSITVFANVYSNALIRDAQVNSEQSVQQTTIAMNNYLENMKDKLDKVGQMINLCDTITEFNEQAPVLTNMQSDIYAVMIYKENGTIVSCINGEFDKKDKIYRNLSYDRELFSNAKEYAVSRPHVQTLFEGEYPWVVTMARRENCKLFGGDVYIAIDFKFNEIAKYIDNVGVGRHGYCYMIDGDGNIVYHPQQQLIFSGLKSEPLDEISSYKDGVHNGDNVIYTLESTAAASWRVVGVAFTEEMSEERSAQIIYSVAISILCCAAILAVVLIVYSHIVNAPMRRLMREMKRFEKNTDTFMYEGQTECVAELHELSDSFEHMTNRIKRLMERVRSDETALRKTELKALQAQINPHFLYNTLDSIQWMCEQGNNEEAVKMVGALARLFRISISHGQELIPIKDELQHAKSYLIIQSFRYRNQFSYGFQVEPGLEEFVCNKITIQPLIENAIYHGIDRMVDEGEIKITVNTAKDDDSDIIITVEDNGVGMTEEQCKKILQKERSDSSGIGVKNVNDRLKIYFGKKYGITIESELDEGTVVKVRIPKITKEQVNEL